MITPAYYCFDVETRPLPDAVERFARRFPDFDEAAVKVGNIKDPLKIAEKKIQARMDHESERTAYWAEMHERAALDPFTGAVVAIGVCSDKGPVEIIAEKTEAATLRQFWQLFAMSMHAVTPFVFWSGCGDPSRKFDIDFLVTRSRICRVPVPPGVRSGRFYGQRIVDAAGEFLLHQRDRYLSLTKACEMFGLYEEHRDLVPKRDDDIVTGANFYLWWDGFADADRSADEQHQMARAYLRNDVHSLRFLAPLALGMHA